MKKKYKRAGTTSERQDYRKGGLVGDGKRVKVFGGGEYGADFSKQLSNVYSGNFNFGGADLSNISIPTNTPAPKPEAAPAPIFTAPITPAQQTQQTQQTQQQNNTTFTQGQSTIGSGDVGSSAGGTVGGFKILGTTVGGTTVDKGNLSPEALDRKRKDLEAQAAGRGIQATPMQVQTLAGQTTQGEIQPGTGDLGGLQTVTGTTGQTQTPEQVSTAAPTQAAQPQQVAPAQIAGVETVTAQPTQAAVGTISDKSVAEKVDVSTVPTITGVDVDIKEGALTDRVVAQMSPEAVAQAAQVNGLDVRRVTRAKEELRNAGIDEITISELGNDPAALENRLMNLTDKERGLVAGLPEEALVSTQMNTLLAGIEQGTVPAWARPAVAQVDAILAQRGLEASTVGRDALLNTIIQSALPIAQSNAKAIQTSLAQEKATEAQVALKEAEFRQQAALTNANNVFKLDLAQFSADQQTNLFNSKFLQTISLAEATNDQQATLQNAAFLSQANLAQASIDQQRQINNAKAFLQMDMANLSAEQQSRVIESQQKQQVALSNAAAQNAARQFNATSENQVNQFMATLAADTEKFNTTQMNAIQQFNVTQANAASARDSQRLFDLEKFNTGIRNQIEQFNSAIENNKREFNAKNSLAIAQSNAQWRRQIATADTAAINAAAEQAVKQNFQLTSQAQQALWQDLRDQAHNIFTGARKDKDIVAQIVADFASNQFANDEAMNGMLQVVKSTITSLTDYSIR